MQQHTKFWLLSSIFIIGLTGCGNNEETAVQDGRKDSTIPIGYYSNETHDANGGNVILLEGDNDGPATESLDHTLGKERDTHRQGDKGVKSKNGIYKINNREFFSDGRPVLGDDDKNYHGHLNNNELPTRQSYYTGNEGKLSEKITSEVRKVANVTEAQTVIDKKSIIVGILLNDENKAEETKRSIRKAIEPYANGRSVKVMTNESQYNRIKVINNDLRNGGPKDELDKEIRNMNQVNENTD